ncbi:hypothetical protein [Roseiconus lacunae]|uniref:Fe2OG dioxygenase domain-containing protein n=1 Tax=Roseiconus lacunae TaxID=2605694 RepID=A0ABT7PNV7_9BACT|nr:hypothetical protein [Roseiconus lacunae]MDM4018192.1 hypothetical protein [Roseiconus lacunae]
MFSQTKGDRADVGGPVGLTLRPLGGKPIDSVSQHQIPNSVNDAVQSSEVHQSWLKQLAKPGWEILAFFAGIVSSTVVRRRDAANDQADVALVNGSVHEDGKSSSVVDLPINGVSRLGSYIGAKGRDPNGDRKGRKTQPIFTERGSSLIRNAGFLDADILRGIIDGDPLLAVIDDAIDPAIAEPMACHLLAAEWGSYSDDIGAGHIGTLKDFNSLFECFEDTACDDYFDRAGQCMPKLSQAIFPYANPAEWILRHLDRVWPWGAELLEIGGRPCYVGLPRAFSEGGAAELHTDRADWDLPAVETSQIKSQLAFNFCLSQTSAPGSGSLALWSGVPDKALYARHRRTDIPYALDESLYGEPDVLFRPLPGQLYIFNASRPHAVRAASGDGTRVTISGFIDYFGEGLPLRLHS